MSKERYTKVFDFFWDDENIVLLSDDAKLLYLYVMTCRHGNAAGIFILPKGYIQDDLRWADKRLDKPFIELLNNGLILYDDHSRVLVVVNHLKHNKVENPNQVKNVHDTISLLPKSKGYSGFIKRLDKPFHKPLVEGLSKRLPQPVAVTVTETVTVKTSCQQQAVDESPIPLKQNKKPCPHTEIINLYHEKLPELASISTKVVGGKEQYNWTGARASHLKSRWAESERRQTVEWWSDFFGFVKESDFLMGKTSGTNGRSFKADLGWLIKPENFNKVVEGKYTK